ncbi:MAG: hypothetical protein OEW39_02150 [Deltaproteobacteria bacterium]|nr:hypothetical protein [Deltaproteobacteria bacterium]
MILLNKIKEIYWGFLLMMVLVGCATGTAEQGAMSGMPAIEGKPNSSPHGLNGESIQAFFSKGKTGDMGAVHDPITDREGEVTIVGQYLSAGGRSCKSFIWVKGNKVDKDSPVQLACLGDNGRWYTLRPMITPMLKP